MAEVKKFYSTLKRDAAEELGLLPDRFYLVFKPTEDVPDGFDVVAYDTMPSNKDLHPVFYVMKGILELLDSDMEKIVAAGQMAVIDKITEASQSGSKPDAQELDPIFKKIDIGKKH